MSKFNPEYYRQFRPFYPPEIFKGFRNELLRRKFNEPFQVVDLGCGTGHSTASLLKTSIRANVIGIDPDPEMLNQARELARSLQLGHLRLKEGTGEVTGLPSESVDAALLGSAFHWMNPEQTRDELIRILKDSGLIWIFEYQFPKAPALPELNEWIRRQFNLVWKAPGQVPRGSFTEVTRVFRQDARFELLSELRPPMIQHLTMEELAGLIFSQSRVLCYEDTLSSSEKTKFRDDTRDSLRDLMGIEPAVFHFTLQGLSMAKTPATIRG